MKLTILQENFLKALTRTSRVLSPRPHLPVLQNILLEAADGRLRATGTSLETTALVEVGAKVEKDGGICAPARIMLELVSSLPAGAVDIEARGGSLFVTSAGVSASVPCVSAGEFPPPAATNRKKGTRLAKDALVGALGTTLFAAATDEGRPLLTGAKIKQKDGEMEIVATDGYRLGLRRVKTNSDTPLDFVIPAKALFEVLRVGAEEKGTEEVLLFQNEDGQVAWVIQDTEIQTRAIDGQYPDYEKIIPKTHTTTAAVDPKAFARAAKSAAIFARDSANIVRLTLGEPGLEVMANTPAVGENRVVVDAKISGEGGTIAFNSRFLLEFLSNVTADELSFEMSGSLNPGLFRVGTDSSHIHIIMPVRVQA